MNHTTESINQITDEQIKQTGYDFFVNHGDFFIAVAPMTFGKGRIIYCESLLFIDNGWCYKSISEAVVAMLEWNPKEQKEPEGWFRNPMDGRRRPDGDPTKEYINP